MANRKSPSSQVPITELASPPRPLEADPYAAGLVRAIRSSFRSLSDDAFDPSIGELVRRLASLVHDLPGSRNHHHVEPFGLLIHSLETAYWAARRPLPHAIRSSILKGDSTFPVADQFVGLRSAIVATALVHDAGKILKAEVTASPGRDRWDPSKEDLAVFARRHPRRRVGWPGHGLVLHDYQVLLDHEWILRRLLPPALTATLSRFTPWGGITLLLASPRADAAAVLRFVASGDASSQFDNIAGRDPLQIVAYRSDLRRIARNPGSVVPAVPASAVAGVPDRHRPWIARLVRIAVARAHVNRAIADAVERFRTLLNPGRYGPFFRGAGRPDRAASKSHSALLEVGWGMYPSKAMRQKGHVPFTRAKLSVRNVIASARLARYLTVFQAAEAALAALRKHGIGITNHLQRIRGSLARIQSTDLPPALEESLAAILATLPRRFGVPPDVEDLVARLLTVLRQYDEALRAARRFVGDYEALLKDDTPEGTWPQPRPLPMLARHLTRSHGLRPAIAAHPDAPDVVIGPVWTKGGRPLPVEFNLTVRWVKRELRLPKFWAEMMPRIEAPRRKLLLGVLSSTRPVSDLGLPDPPREVALPLR